MKTQSIRLSEIRTDAGTQSRAVLTQDKVAEYAERMTEGDVFPPIILFHDGSECFLADGFHRVMACERNGFKDVLAEVRRGTQRDALWYSLGANKDHGIPRTTADKHRAINIALKEFSEKSDREIASHCNVSHPTVSKLRAEMVSVGKITNSKTRTGKDGKQYKASKTKPAETAPAADCHALTDTRTEAQKTEAVFKDLAESVKEEKKDEPVTLKDLQIAFEESVQPLWIKADAKTKKAFVAWLKE